MIDAVRSYLREIRLARDISLDEFADIIGMARRTLIEWEQGRTGDIKATPLMRAVAYFGVPPEHLTYLITVASTEEEGRHLAQQWLHGEQISTEPTEGDIVHVMELALQLRGDRPRLAQMVGIGRRLVQERAREQQGGEGEQ